MPDRDTSTLHAYHGTCLRVDLTAGAATALPLPERRLRQFLGGSGLGTLLLLQENAAAADALSPEASLAFAFSPLVGSPLTTSAKFAVVCKSPLTERINDSLASSGFAIAGKKTGHDVIVLTGKAAVPSIVVIDEGHVHLEPAGDLWGLECSATQQRLQERYPGGFEFAVIGPAGENQVLYATISHDGRHAGRGGSGAVLGAKNVKAVVVRGSREIRWAHPEPLIAYARQLSKKSFGPATAKYRELGTATNLLVFNRLKALPTRNFQQGSFAGAEAIAPESLAETRSRTRAYCAACTIGCEHLYSLDNGKDRVRLEYENLFALGSLCDIRDPEVVLLASKRCDELGLDTISTGGTLAFAMECAERGFLNAPWLRFGNGESLLRAIELIAARQDLGDVLALGSRRLAEHIGHDSIRWAPQVKGLEMPGYEPRALQTMALGLAVGARGADHNRSGAYEVDFSAFVDRRQISEHTARLAAQSEDKAAIMDSLILCKFLRGVFEDFYEDAAEMLHLVSGWDVASTELQQIAARIVTAKKLFNIQAGWSPEEDTLPARMLSEPLPDDPHAQLGPAEFKDAVSAYNLWRNWTEEGWICAELRAQLDLDAFPAAGGP